MVDLTDYASKYIPEYQIVAEIPAENMEYLNSCIPYNMTRTFYGTTNISTIDISKMNLSNVTTMEKCFSTNDKDNKSIDDIIGLDTVDISKVSNLSGLFYNCEFLSEKVLNRIVKLDVSNVTNLSSFMDSCTFNDFVSDGNFILDFSSWNTKNVTSLEGFCNYLPNATYNFSNWDLSSLSYKELFLFTNGHDGSIYESLYNDLFGEGNENATTDPVMLVNKGSFGTRLPKKIILQNWKFSKEITSLRGLFINCGGNTVIDVTGWDTSHIEDLSYLFAKSDYDGFDNGYIKEIIGLETWDISNCKNLNYFTNEVTNPTFNISNWDTKNIKYIISPFNPYVATGGDITYLHIITNGPLDFQSVIETGDKYSFLYDTGVFFSQLQEEIHIKNFPISVLNKIQNEYGKKLGPIIVVDNYLNDTAVPVS